MGIAVILRVPSLRGAQRQSNPVFISPPSGLLRFARNDETGRAAINRYAAIIPPISARS
jgi:hypothetical protein